MKFNSELSDFFPKFLIDLLVCYNSLDSYTVRNFSKYYGTEFSFNVS